MAKKLNPRIYEEDCHLLEALRLEPRYIIGFGFRMLAAMIFWPFFLTYCNYRDYQNGKKKIPEFVLVVVVIWSLFLVPLLLLRVKG